jgi:hypothetical protein
MPGCWWLLADVPGPAGSEELVGWLAAATSRPGRRAVPHSPAPASHSFPLAPAPPASLLQAPGSHEVLRARHMSIHQVTRLEELWRSNPTASGGW